MKVRIFNKSKNKLIADSVTLAQGFFQRLRGLLGRKNLPPGEGLVLEPCQAIHTFFMLFPIDVIFVSKEGRVVGIEQNKKPFRMSGWYRDALWALELAANSLSPETVGVGDELEIETLSF